MTFFSDLFGKKEDEPIKHRIVKSEWPSGRVEYYIEEYSGWIDGNKPFWHVLNFMGTRNSFKTHEEASTFLKVYLTPPEKPVITVVEEV